MPRGLFYFLLAALPCWAPLSARGQEEAAAPPDIVIVLSDDQTWSDSGCYGNKQVKTPNIDRLAAEGMRFTRAFTATAMCAPTRQQLYTGLFPVRNGAYPNHSKVKTGTRSIVHFLRERGYRVGLSGKKHFGPPASFPFEKVSRGKMGEFIGRKKSQPYCLVVTSHSPHLPWSEGDPSAYDPGKVKLPARFVDTPQTRQAMVKYYAEITDFDRELGECMAAVHEGGREENTIFIYTSEQGAQFPGGKWTCYEMGLHVALVVRWPRQVKAGSVADAMVQYVDVVPTLLAAAGAAKVEGFDGKSFLGVLRGKTDEHHDAVFGVHTTRGIINGSPCYPVRSVRTATHKYIWNPKYREPFRNVLIGGGDKGGYWKSWVELAKTDEKARRIVEGYQRRPEVELYDLRTDPFEQKNLAGDPQLKDVERSLRGRLDAWMLQQGDKGIETELRVKAHRSVSGQEQKPGKERKKKSGGRKKVSAAALKLS